MGEDHKKILQQQLWNIANTLRGKMNANDEIINKTAAQIKQTEYWKKGLLQQMFV